MVKYAKFCQIARFFNFGFLEHFRAFYNPFSPLQKGTSSPLLGGVWGTSGVPKTSEEKLHLQLEGQHLAMHLELQTLQRRLKLHSDKVQTKQEAAGLKQVEGTMFFFTLKTRLEIGGEDNTYPKWRLCRHSSSFRVRFKHVVISLFFLCENPKKSPRVKEQFLHLIVCSLINLHKLHCQWGCDTPKIDLSYSKKKRNLAEPFCPTPRGDVMAQTSSRSS